MGYEGGSFDDECDWDQRRLPHVEIVIEQNARQHVEVYAVYVTNRGKLAGLVAPMNAPSLD